MSTIKPRRIKKVIVEKRDEGWVTIDPNNDSFVSDPYSTKAEATEDKKGLEQYWRWYHDRTTEEIEEIERDFNEST